MSIRSSARTPDAIRFTDRCADEYSYESYAGVQGFRRHDTTSFGVYDTQGISLAIVHESG